jgi:hypothetical protein
VLQYNNTLHTNNTHHSRKFSILKITKKYKNHHQHIFYTIETQKRVEPKVDESIIKTTKYTEQSVHHTVQHSVTHISPNSQYNI